MIGLVLKIGFECRCRWRQCDQLWSFVGKIVVVTVAVSYSRVYSCFGLLSSVWFTLFEGLKDDEEVSWIAKVYLYILYSFSRATPLLTGQSFAKSTILFLYGLVVLNMWFNINKLLFHADVKSYKVYYIRSFVYCVWSFRLMNDALQSWISYWLGASWDGMCWSWKEPFY